MSGECIFCEIIRGEAPASVVYRDEKVMAFMDIQPVNAGHVLVVPLEHVVSLVGLDDETAGRLMAVGKWLAAAVKASGVRWEGFNLWVADGEAAGQEVFHVHLHMFPRYEGDGFGLTKGPNYHLRPSRGELEQVAAAIRKAGGWQSGRAGS